jgi:hypothetical protein
VPLLACRSRFWGGAVRVRDRLLERIEDGVRRRWGRSLDVGRDRNPLRFATMSLLALLGACSGGTPTAPTDPAAIRPPLSPGTKKVAVVGYDWSGDPISVPPCERSPQGTFAKEVYFEAVLSQTGGNGWSLAGVSPGSESFHVNFDLIGTQVSKVVVNGRATGSAQDIGHPHRPANQIRLLLHSVSVEGDSGYQFVRLGFRGNVSFQEPSGRENRCTYVAVSVQ